MSSNPLPIPQQEPKKETYTEWVKRGYNQQYESWTPWAQDQYLKWFGKDNKASYATKDTLSKTKVTGVKQVDTLQDGVNDLIAGQVGKGGIAQPIGDMASKEGVNRAQRGGKDNKGRMMPDSMGDVAKPVSDGAKGLGNSVTSGAKNAGGYLGGVWGGKKEEKE